MVRRLKSELPPHWDGTPRIPPRRLEALEVNYTAKERQVHTWLQQYTRLRQKNALLEEEVERLRQEVAGKKGGRSR